MFSHLNIYLIALMAISTSLVLTAPTPASSSANPKDLKGKQPSLDLNQPGHSSSSDSRSRSRSPHRDPPLVGTGSLVFHAIDLESNAGKSRPFQAIGSASIGGSSQQPPPVVESEGRGRGRGGRRSTSFNQARTAQLQSQLRAQTQTNMQLQQQIEAQAQAQLKAQQNLARVQAHLQVQLQPQTRVQPQLQASPSFRPQTLPQPQPLNWRGEGSSRPAFEPQHSPQLALGIERSSSGLGRSLSIGNPQPSQLSLGIERSSSGLGRSLSIGGQQPAPALDRSTSRAKNTFWKELSEVRGALNEVHEVLRSYEYVYKNRYPNLEKRTFADWTARAIDHHIYEQLISKNKDQIENAIQAILDHENNYKAGRRILGS